MAVKLVFPSKFKVVFVVILIGLISMAVDVAREILFFRQGTPLDAFLVFIPKYKLYSRMVLLLAIIALGGFVYCYYDQLSIKEKEKREHFQASIFAGIRDGLCILDNDLTILQVNPALEKWYGHAQPLVGKKCYQAFRGRSEPCDHCSCRRTLETGEPAAEIVPKIGPKGGTVGWLDLYTFPLLDPDTGKIKGVIEYLRDITERKRGEEALQEAHQTLQAYIQAAPLAIYVMNPEGKIQIWNPAAERLFGWKEEEVLGFSLPTIPINKIEEAKGLFRKVLGGESLHGLELQRRKKDGSPIDVSVFSAPLYDTHGRVTGVMSLNMDITESKRLKEQLLHSQKMEVVGRLAGGVAHDFNNLLTAITGYSELVLNFMDDNNPLRQDVAEIRKAGQRAASLTRQLLAFSRKQVLQPEVLDLNLVVEDLGKMLRRLLPSDIDLVVSTTSNPGRVVADPGQIEQVILNLAINARDAMAGGGRLTITTANMVLDESHARRLPEVEPGSYVMLEVRDTGCGMDPETRSHIFEPFFTTKETGKGTGLGLSTVYGIIKQSGGHIAVHSEPQKGTAFEIYLPRISGELESGAQVSREPASRYQGRETILLVEDEDGVRQLVSTVLQRHGFRVLEARHGTDALDLIARHPGPIHLVLTDVVMPGMGGLELAQRLKPLHPDLKVLYMSGYAEYAHPHQGQPDQEISFLQKPFEAQGLLQRVRNLLDAPA